jgi:hypothetical protein
VSASVSDPDPRHARRIRDARPRHLVERLSLGSYPTQRQFVEARVSGLYRAIANRLGGHQAMAARLGLPPSDGRRR